MEDEVSRATREAFDMMAQAMGPIPYHGNISPRVYLVGQALAGLLAQCTPTAWDVADILLVGKLAVRITDATLDAMTWPNGKPEEKR